MGHAVGCVRPVVFQESEKIKPLADQKFTLYVDYSLTDHINQVKPYLINFEMNSKCYGSCMFCLSNSPEIEEDIVMPKEEIFEVLDDAYEEGVRAVEWCGGDPLLHPEWKAVVRYASDKGILSSLALTIISKKQAKEIMELIDCLEMCSFHISSVNHGTYDQVHKEPRTMEMKMQSYRNLLDVGFPPERVMAFITTTKQACETMEETIDWYVDEMGCQCVTLSHWKPTGVGRKHLDFEPSLSDTKKVMEYRAKKLGSHWLKQGASESALHCRILFGILYNGAVTPCINLRESDLCAGNIYQERLKDIFSRPEGRNMLLKNHEIDYCGGECHNNPFCGGCVAANFLYTGDEKVSNPKCPFNPHAQEYYCHPDMLGKESGQPEGYSFWRES